QSPTHQVEENLVKYLLNRCASHWVISNLATMSFAVLLVGMIGVSAQAQSYDAKPIDESARLLRYKAQQFARLKQGDSKDFGRFMTQYVLAKLTDPSPQGLGELAKTRYELFRDFVLPSEAQVQKQLTQVLLAEMGKLANNTGGNFHLSVRYNAVIIIGMLDATYPDASRRPAVPLPAANEFLTQLA